MEKLGPVTVQLGKEVKEVTIPAQAGPASESHPSIVKLRPNTRVTVAIDEDCVTLQPEGESVAFIPLSQVILRILSQKTPFTNDVLAAQAQINKVSFPDEINQILERFLGDHVG